MVNLEATSRTLRRMERRQVNRAGRCDILRGTGEGTFDADGNWTPGGETVASGVRCWIAPSLRRGAVRTVDVAGAQVTLPLFEVKVPHDTDVQELDVVKPTVSRDPALIGSDLVVRQVTVGEYLVSRVLICEAAT